jgi:hypothetical protein
MLPSRDGCGRGSRKMPKYSYQAEVHAQAAEHEPPDDYVWWADCQWCGYDGPETPIPGLEPRPGFHEVYLCPSCFGVMFAGHIEVDKAKEARKPAKDSDD